MVRAQDLLVLEHCLGRLPVVDLGHQPPPRADAGLENHGVAELLDGLQRGLRGEGNQVARHREIVLQQRLRGEQFVAADAGGVGAIEGLHAPAVQHVQGVLGA